MAGPTAARVEHYLRMFETLRDAEWHLEENLGWTVVRPHQGQLSVDDVVRLLRGDPAAMTTRRPVDVGWEDDLVYLEQRGDAVMILEYAGNTAEEAALRRLSQGASVHGVLWGINNFNQLFHVVDGIVVTELDTLRPDERSGADPEALTGHLGALLELHDPSAPHRSADWDWPTAIATMESLVDLRLDADWFLRPQVCATVNSR